MRASLVLVFAVTSALVGAFGGASLTRSDAPVAPDAASAATSLVVASPAVAGPVAPAEPQQASCGDGRCAPPEDCNSCPSDCGSCCGDGRCAPPEDCNSCPRDCGSCCGDGRCYPPEDCNSCPRDCGGC